MAFKSVTDKPKKRIKKIGALKKAVKYDGFYLKIEEDCDLILYVPDTGEYYKVLKVPAKVEEDGNTLFSLEVDLDKPQQVEFKTKD
jgi:hypothetical protein